QSEPIKQRMWAAPVGCRPHPVRGGRLRPYGVSPRVAVIVMSLPSRVTVIVSLSPTEPACTAATRSSLLATTVLFALVTTSPVFRPAFSAGLPDSTEDTCAPPACASVTLTPRNGWLTLPPLMSWSVTDFTLLAEMANPTPMLPLEPEPEVAIALLMPI